MIVGFANWVSSFCVELGCPIHFYSLLAVASMFRIFGCLVFGKMCGNFDLVVDTNGTAL
jgi:hypothetical protein